MAESSEVIVIEDSEEEKNNIDCPICLQTCSFPTKLPCGHVFCFLCVKVSEGSFPEPWRQLRATTLAYHTCRGVYVKKISHTKCKLASLSKGVANKNRRCALCRRDIPIECLEHPQLLRGTKDLSNSNISEFRWFYEGRNGWWQYDDRTSQDIEDAYQRKDKTSSILVAGHLYLVDFEAMTQLRQDDHSRRRRVKRDLGTVPKKGVAGLRILNNTVVTDITPTTSESAMTSEDVPVPTLGTQNAASTTDSALRIATHIIDSTLANSDDYQSSDETGRDVSQEIFDDSDLLEGIRNLTLRNMVDSSDSENENIF